MKNAETSSIPHLIKDGRPSHTRFIRLQMTAADPGQNVCMGGMAIVKSETLDVLGTSIRSDLRSDDHVFNVSKEAAF